MPAGEMRSAGGWRAIGRPDVMLAAGLAVVLLPTSLLAIVQTDVQTSTSVVVALAVLFALLHALSLVAIRFPVASFIGASAVMLALAMLPGGAGIPAAIYPSSFAYLLCLAQVTATRERRLGLAALAVGVLGAIIIALTPAAPLDAQVRWGTFVGLVALVAAAWAVGALQKVRREQADDRARVRVQQAITVERMRINRDLHDVVAHSMTVMIAQAEAARAVVHDDPDEGSRAMSIVAETGREALRGMRGIVAAGADAPREPVPDLDAISQAIHGARSVETDVSFVEDGQRHPLDPAARIALHHAVREALTNAIRHTTPPRRVDVRMQWDAQRIVTTVVDNGGSGTPADSPGAGVGLIGMVERVRSAGGTVTVGSTNAAGWAVRIELPYTRVAEQELQS